MKSLAAATIAAVVGASGALLTATTDAQARVRVTVSPRNTQPFYIARVKYCGDQLKGLYRAAPGQIDAFTTGYCLSDIAPQTWNKTWWTSTRR